MEATFVTSTQSFAADVTQVARQISCWCVSKNGNALINQPAREKFPLINTATNATFVCLSLPSYTFVLAPHWKLNWGTRPWNHIKSYQTTSLIWWGGKRGFFACLAQRLWACSAGWNISAEYRHRQTYIQALEVNVLRQQRETKRKGAHIQIWNR